MAKTKTFEDAKKILETAKATRTAAREALEAFRKEHKIKQGTKSEEITDKKIKVPYKELVKAVNAAKAAVETAEAEAKELKPTKVRETKYEYPANATSDEKKKIRTAARAKAKREAKEAAGGTTKKADKKADKKSEDKSEKKADKKSDGKSDKKAEKKAKKSED